MVTCRCSSTSVEPLECSITTPVRPFQGQTNRVPGGRFLTAVVLMGWPRNLSRLSLKNTGFLRIERDENPHEH